MRPAITTRHALLRLVAAAALLAPAAPLAAQTAPVPTLPKAPVPDEEPPPAPAPKTSPGKAQPAPTPKTPRAEPAEPAAVVGEPRPQPWEYRLGVGVIADTNTDFMPGGSSGTAIVPAGRIARILSSSRGELRAEAAGRWIGFPSQDIVDRTYVDAGVRGDYESSPRTSWRGDVHYWLGYTDSSPTLIEQGVALPVGKSGTFSGEVALDQTLGERTFLRAGGRVLSIEFDDPDYIDGASLRATLEIGRRLGARDSASFAYALERVGFGEEGESYFSHFGSLQWTRTLSPQSAVLLEAGASYTPAASEVGMSRSEGFFGGVSFRRQIGRSSLNAYLRREVAPAFGLGVSRLETRLGLRADKPMGRDWVASLAAFHIQPETPEGETKLFASSSDVVATLDRRFGRHFTISGEARYRRRGEVVYEPPLSAFQGGLYLTFGTSER